MSKFKVVKRCPVCECGLTWEAAPNRFAESSADTEDFPLCYECMIEHCIRTNCYVCNYGKYPECRFLEMKLHCLKGS
jgi:hypothetical protein